MTGLRTAAAVIMAASVTACSQEPVVLGIASGSVTVEAALMALEDAVADGLDVPIDTVIVREGTNMAAPAVRAADTIVSTPGVVAVMGHSNSAASLTAAPIYNRARVVQIASHSTAEIYSEAEPYSFRMVPPDGQQGRAIAEFLAREYRGRRLALTYVNDDYGRGLRANVLDALPPGAVDIVVDVPHITLASPEMVQRTVRVVVDARPDGILWLGRALQLQAYLPGLREALGRVPIIGGDALNPAEHLPDPEGLFPPLHFVRLVDMDARPGTRQFSERFRARFGQDLADAGALAYDAFAVLLAGVEAGVRTGEEMREYLMSLGRDRPAYEGITGPLRFNEHGDAYREYVMGRMTEGQTGVAAP
ncbi:MAG: branched-chain amino acid ABC transporter substrate-binding protein [Longimicrobiales bacterium]